MFELKRSFCAFLMLIACAFGVAPFAQALPTTRTVELVEDYKPQSQGSTLDLYIPLPMRDKSYQKIQSENFESNATWVKEEAVKMDASGDNIRILHAHWDHPAEPKLQLREQLKLMDRNGERADKKSDSYFLEPTDHVQLDGIVHETAAKITKGLTDPDKKAEFIFNWIVENSFRDPKTRGCGLGDVKTMLQSGNLGGKCADLNSLFVGLARASGIPAREVWGLRVAPSDRSKSLGKEGDVSKSQHCRAEYYSTKKQAWIPADPADIRKVILEEKLSLDDPHIKELRPRFFGTWEGNWVALNFGRDFALSNGKKLNFLMYPQLFTGSRAPDGVDPMEVGYTFTSKLLAN